MDGLEAVEINYSVLDNVIDHRIEAEYFNRKFLAIDNRIIKNDTFAFNEIAKAINGRPYSSDAFGDNGIFISKIGDVTNKRDINSWEKVSEIEFERQGGVFITDGDILMTLTGDPPDVGKVNLVSCGETSCTWNQRVALIERKSQEIVSNNVLFVLLSSDFVRTQAERFAKGIRQRNLGNDCFNRIRIPKFSYEFQYSLNDLINNYRLDLDTARTLYSSAQSLLLSSLNYQPIVQTLGYSEKSFSASFGATGRLDAEYYQPKYDELFQSLSALPTKRLKSVVNIMKSIEPGSEYYGNEGIPFIRVSDVSKNGINTPSIRIPKTTVPSIENLYPKKDTILFSKDGSVGIAYKVEADMEAVTSGALLHLTVKDTTEVLPDYLTLLLNSDIVKLQAERDASGAIIQHWKPSDIEQVVVPILPLKMQRQISEKIEESFSLRRQSKQLLENAKHAVEMAIEQGEDKAMRWLQEQGEI